MKLLYFILLFLFSSLSYADETERQAEDWWKNGTSTSPLTYHQFKSIKLCSSYEDAFKIFKLKGTVITDEPGEDTYTSYQWHYNDSEITIILVRNKIIAKVIFIPHDIVESDPPFDQPNKKCD